MGKMVKKRRVKSQPSWKDKYMFMNAWRTNKVSKDFIELLCGEMLEYFAASDAISITKFLCEKGINWEVFLRWVDDFPDLASVYKQVKARVGARREEMAIFRKYNCNPSTIERTLHKYDPVWKEAHEEDRMDKLEASNYQVIMSPLEAEDGRVVELEDKKTKGVDDSN